MDKKDKILLDVLNSAESNDFKGFSKFDALNSPLLNKLSFDNKWLRLIYTQLVKESPVHIRPLLNIEKSKNPKGIALFTRAYLSLYKKTVNGIFLRKAEELLDWLLENPSPDQNNLCWGYNFRWQNTIFLQDEFEPNTVVSVFIGEALIHAYRVTKKEKYLESARSVASFIVEDLPVIHQNNEELAIGYVLRKVDAIVLNNQVLAGAFLIKVWQHSKEELLKETAIRLINYTVNRKTDYYAWYYTYPKNKSPITHDNYHTGGILDGIFEYFEETGDQRYMDVYWKGLEYYQERLFEKNGAPRWMNNKKYPFDIHGSAQGILTFTKAAKYKVEYSGQAEKIANWAIDNLYKAEKKEFIYRKGRFYYWNYSLMRWCNAWMARALGELISINYQE